METYSEVNINAFQNQADALGFQQVFRSLFAPGNEGKVP